MTGPVHDLVGWDAVAQLLDVHPRTAQRWADESGLPVYQLRGRIRAYAAEVRAWLAGAALPRVASCRRTPRRTPERR